MLCGGLLVFRGCTDFVINFCFLKFGVHNNRIGMLLFLFLFVGRWVCLRSVQKLVVGY